MTSTLTAADIAAMAADAGRIIAERPLSVAFRRGETTLPAQTVRVVARSGSSTRRGEMTAAPHWPLVVIGPAALDVAVGDRFNAYGGELCEVKAIHNDRRAFTQAEADLAE